MARLRAVLHAVFLLPLLLTSKPSPSSLPYSLLRLVEFKANDEVVEQDLKFTAELDDGLNRTTACLAAVPDARGGRLLCSARAIFESQFEPRGGLMGKDTFDGIYKDLLNYTNHPCNHGSPPSEGDEHPPPGPSAEVIIALQGGFLLYGCHNYISLALQRPKNELLSNFALLKAFKVPHSLVSERECAETPAPPCTLTALSWNEKKTLIAEDYVCCCNGTGCAAVIVDQGGLISPFPLLRFNVELDDAVTAQISAMIYPHGGGRYRIDYNGTTTRRRHNFRNLESFGMTDIMLISMVFLTIVGAMALLLCFQWFCQDTIVNDA